MCFHLTQPLPENWVCQETIHSSYSRTSEWDPQTSPTQKPMLNETTQNIKRPKALLQLFSARRTQLAHFLNQFYSSLKEPDIYKMTN